MKNSTRAFLVPVISLVLIQAGCGGPAEKQPAQAAGAAPAQAGDPMEIRIDEMLVSRVTTAVARRDSVDAPLTVSARVEVDATRMNRIGTPVAGRVSSLRVEEGQVVRKSELLALLQSAGLNQAQLELLKALSQQMVSRRSVDRAHLLLKGGVIGAAELQRREAELAQATAELEAARDELGLLGFPPEDLDELERTRQIHSIARITATMDGTIIHRRVTQGQVVQPADTAFEIADLSNLWIIADVPEQAAGDIVAGQPVTAEISVLAGEKVNGRLSFVSALVNPETRTVVVRMNLPNPHGRFKPAMLATLTIQGHREERIVVPESAVVREGDGEYVFVQRQAGVFRLTPVRAAQTWRGLRVILDGLAGAETIVSEGAFHLNNERRRRSIRGKE
ncbi:MAG: efflux transporter periplasmic adaptor subunit [Candidatus Solibacter sp.]|nr:efflux transporter periplasmic adaptor subunit [Candidatus Solibacter sp.]